MNIAFIGLGKLGFPCAVALAMKGHRVFGYDTDAALIARYRAGHVPPFEPGLDQQYAACRERISFCRTIDEAVAASEFVFVAAPTPHAPTHDGSRPYDGVPRDFDNAILRDCLTSIGRAIESALDESSDGPFRTVLIISTVTPGTTLRTLAPALERGAGRPLGDGWGLVYNPFFIGQSTVVQDFLNPEFVLAGHAPSDEARERTQREVERLYATLHAKPIRQMGFTEAECVKLCYNTYLGLKVVFANTVMELCHHLPDCDCDTVNGALKLATDRLISAKYMDGGMADGGPCHGRDQMAMSFAVQRLGLSFDIFDTINRARDAQTGFLAKLVEQHRTDPRGHARPVVILGTAFKPHTNQTQGSPSLLLASILRERGIEPVLHDPAVAPNAPLPTSPAVYVLATRWPEYRTWRFGPADVIIDPWRTLAHAPVGSVNPGATLVSVGRGPASPERGAATDTDRDEPVVRVATTGAARPVRAA